VRLELPKICHPVKPNDVQKILSNRFYTGRTYGNNGEWALSVSHKVLITDEITISA